MESLVIKLICASGEFGLINCCFFKTFLTQQSSSLLYLLMNCQAVIILFVCLVFLCSALFSWLVVDIYTIINKISRYKSGLVLK